MSRTILIHLNVKVPEGDERSAEEITASVMMALEVGSDNPLVDSLYIVCAMSEEA